VKKVIEFRLATHTLSDEPMVEVWRDDTFVASIYGHHEGVLLLSKFLDGFTYEAGRPTAVIIKLSEG